MYNYSQRIKIDGNNVAIHKCLDCGRKLSQHEFNMKFDRCSTCNREHHKNNRGRGFADLSDIND